jgi:FkbM family methyltransferase
MDIKKKLIDKNIVLVGGGQLGHMALDLWPLKLKLPIAILDRIKRGYISGIPVVNIEDHEVLQSNIYILSYFKESAEGVKRFFSEVLRQELITVYDLLTSYSPDVFSNGWIGNSLSLTTASKNIKFFLDEPSRNVYQAALQWRYLRALNDDYPVGLEAEKYTLSQYGIKNHFYDFVIDAGSYDFSFPIHLWSSGVRWRTIVALEPDYKTHPKTLVAADTFMKTMECDFNLIMDKRALWIDSKGCSFYSNGLLSARVTSSKNSSTKQVPSVSLIDLLSEIGASRNSKILIKMHIEGAEWPVINSCKELLKNWVGIDFLINLSHDENSLVKIPALFSELNRHDVLIRSHSLFGEGLTFCARSRENEILLT